ncbi:MAG: hypothetical protein QOI51_1141, partial [Nocardioidaceae bacterium]|nr:hypothetical protein [Nocardioidaceae bacterium]
NGTSDLWHFWHDNSDVTLPWNQAQKVAANVVGPGCLIQSSFGSGDHGNFEVVVPLPGPNGTSDLWHFWHDNSDVTLPWSQAQKVAGDVHGPGSLIQSDFGSKDHGNFEAIVPIAGRLQHVWHDNGDVNKPWVFGQTVTEALTGWGSLSSSTYGQGHRNFEVLAEECAQSVVGYWHPNQDVDLPWLRHHVIVGDPYPAVELRAAKISQLIGEHDREAWDGSGTAPFAPNRTETNAGIRGTDLGVSFSHQGRMCFLFGDTWRVNQTADQVNLDSIAFATTMDPRAGLGLRFLPRPPLLDNDITQREFEVPIDGISLHGDMYVFFSTDHYRVDGWDIMGRTVLARSRDGQSFHYLADLSRHKFINVAAQRATIAPDQAETTNLPAGTELVWLWGSGRYRSSDVCLALLPVSGLPTLSGLRYLDVRHGRLRWSDNESDASRLFCSGSVGELSVRWIEPLQRYVAMYNADNPGGILLHHAPHPWGPWSQTPIMVFDAWRSSDVQHGIRGDGIGRFMHAGTHETGGQIIDHVNDDIIPTDGDPWRVGVSGGAYGPYLIPELAHAEGDAVRIYFTMSTWNPYASMLMTALVPRRVMDSQ